MHEIKGPVTNSNHVSSNKGEFSVVLINHSTNEKIEFPYFALVGFDDRGECISNYCTIPQLAQGLLKLHDLYDELKAEAQIQSKPKLTVLPTITAKTDDLS